MRRLAFFVVGGAILLLLGAMPAAADNGPHMSTVGQLTDRCAGCHRLHSASAAYVLVQSEPSLCYTCHGAGSTGASTDVQEGLGYTQVANASSTTPRVGTPGGLRGGGFEYALINAANPTFSTSGSTNGRVTNVGVLASKAPSTSAHSVDESGQTSWGNGPFDPVKNVGKAGVELTCTSCHDPHGGAGTSGAATFRILKTNPNGYSSDQLATATNCTPTEVDNPNTPANPPGYTSVGTANREGACTFNKTQGSVTNTGYCYITVSYSSRSGTTSWRAICASNVFPALTSQYVESGNTVPSFATPVTSWPSALTIPKPNIQAIGDVGTKTYTTTDYWQGIVDPAIAYTIGNVTDASTNVMAQSAAGLFSVQISNWCAQCHTRYKATSSQTYDQNTGDAVFTYRHRADSPSGATVGTAGWSASPNCIQCHVSHGSNSATGPISSTLQNPGGGTDGLGVGSSPASADNRLLRVDMRGTCAACHAK